MKLTKLLKVTVLLILFLPVHNTFSARYYVSSDGLGTGASWSDALGDIQVAIDLAVFGDEVWVKTGTYRPHDSDRTVSFILKSGIKLYGGFQGNETQLKSRVLNDNDANGFIEPWEFLYPTTLKGEIQGDGIDANNSQHVVIIPDGVGASTLLSGFIVTSGYSDVQSNTPQGFNVCASGIFALGGIINDCLITECHNNSNNIGYGSGIYVDNAIVLGCKVENCSITANTSYGGGISLSNSKISKSKVYNCISSSLISGKAIGGGIYAESSIVDSCQLSSCSAISSDNNRAEGGGIYSNTSIIFDSQVVNCVVSGNQGRGGGVYSITGTMTNSIISNCEAGEYGGGVYSVSTYITNVVIANNKVVNEYAIGGGAYGDGEATFYNTVFWGNETSGTSAQLRLNAGGTANNCAAEEEDLTGNNNINISTQNTGSTTDVLYPQFVSPTNFVGITSGDVTYEKNLLLANWNIEKSSSLIEKGDNIAFNEAHSSVNSDLNGNGNKADYIDNFYDLAGELRLFNINVDIGAYESVFVDLILPATQTIEYGLTLGEITISDGSAIDNRDGSGILGSYAFTDVAVMPVITSVNEKFRVSFTPDDLDKYPVSYDSVMVIVTAKTLYLSGVTSDDKQYDGTISASYSGTAVLDGIIGADDVSLNAGSVVASFSNKHIGVDKTVTYSGFSLLGADKDNYILSVPATQSSITIKTISISVLTANDKIYDGNNIASYSGTPTIIGKVLGDDVDVDITNQSSLFNSKNIGVDKTVTFSGFALSGADKGNYELVQPISSLADITKLSVEVVSVSAGDKIYDGLTNATISGTATVSGLISGDNVSLNTTFASANFNSKNIGADKPVIFSNYSLIGADGNNYNLIQPTSVTATINSKELIINGLSVVGKDYDASTVALFTGTPLLDGVILPEDVSLNTSSVSAVFSDANAGVGKEVNFSSYTLNGIDKDNYHLTQPVLYGDIRTIGIGIAVDAQSKTYGQADPVLSYVITSGGLIGSDTFSGSLSRNSGEDSGGYSITLGNLSLSSNYIIDFSGNTFTINKAQNAIAFELESPIVFSFDKELILSATSSSGMTVKFSSSDNDVAFIPEGSNILTVKSYGSVEITASQSGDNNYEKATSVLISLVISIDVVALPKGDKVLLVNNIQGQFVDYQWYRDNVLIAGAEKQFYYSEAGLTGTYHCMVTTEKGDEFLSNIISTSSPKTMEVYPSPAVAGGNINVELKGFDFGEPEKLTINVYSITGDLVQKITQPENINSFNMRKSGIYIIRTEGGVNLIQKIIVR